MIDKYESKLAKSKKLIESEQGNARDLRAALDAQRRNALEKEAGLSLEMHNIETQMQQLKSALQDKSIDFDASKNEQELKASQLSAKCFEDVKKAREEAGKWKSKYEDLETSTRSWKQFTESALSREQLSCSQFQETCAHLRKDNEEHSKVFTSDIAERNAMIDELNQIVQNTTTELNDSRDQHMKELQHAVYERDAQMAQQEGELQKEIGALQVGLCLQKEMKDRLQLSMNHLKSCLRSLALDLTRPFDKNDEAATRSYYARLCDLFDRLLVSGALSADGGGGGWGGGSGEKSSQNWEKHVSHMHSYINKHTELVSNPNSASGSTTVSQYGQSLNIDSDFLSIIKSMKELLHHVLTRPAPVPAPAPAASGPSLAARAEITRLVEHTQLLRSDLDMSDRLMLSLVGQLMDEGFVDASGK
jgi:glutaredoxin-related protein